MFEKTYFALSPSYHGATLALEADQCLDWRWHSYLWNVLMFPSWLEL